VIGGKISANSFLFSLLIASFNLDLFIIYII
jgi:hypothetical protein